MSVSFPCRRHRDEREKRMLFKGKEMKEKREKGDWCMECKKMIEKRGMVFKGKEMTEKREKGADVGRSKTTERERRGKERS